MLFSYVEIEGVPQPPLSVPAHHISPPPQTKEYTHVTYEVEEKLRNKK
jgi:hypothetical protein